MMTKEELRTHRKVNLYHCPICGEEVKLKVGNKIIPHFSHCKKTKCTSSGESEKHRSGKLALANILKESRIQFEIECRFDCINRIADIYFVFENQKYVIEYQCSKISSDEVLARTTDYQSLDIKVIWIIGCNPSASNKISDNELQFLEDDILIYYDKVFTIVQLITNLSKNVFVTNQIVYSVKDFTALRLIKGEYPFISRKQVVEKQLKDYKIYFRKYGIGYIFKYEYRHSKFMYINSINQITYLSEIGVAIPHQYIINETPFIWQMYFIYEFVKPKSKFNFNQAFYYMRFKFKLRVLPIGKLDLASITKLYLDFLVESKVLLKVDEVYHVNLTNTPKTLDEAITLDEVRIKQLINMDMYKEQ